MRGSSSHDPVKGAAAALVLCLLLPASAAWCATPAIEFAVRHVDARLDGETWLLDAGLDLDFNPESREAMESGVPLTLVLEVEVTRERLFKDERLRSARIRYRLERHALSERYVVTHAASGRTRTYDALEDASASIGTIRDLVLIERGRIDPGHQYRARLRARLDIEALPSPLRPLAWLRSLWRGRDGWFTWVLSS